MLENSLPGVAKYIASDACGRIAFLTGAGVSVAAGIPDFRSPTGMYNTLPVARITCSDAERAEIRADPTAVVEKGMFMRNPFPYLEVRRPFILGTQEARWKATASHRFMELLHCKGKLRRVFTQNIDGLDFQTGVPRERIVSVHGSMGAAACEACGAPEDLDSFCTRVRKSVKDIYDVDESAPAESEPIPCLACGKPTVKTTTVLFGSSLPEEFFTLSQVDMKEIDLLIVAGTSLQVAPANMLTAICACPRVIVNNQAVGEHLGIDYSAKPRAKTRDVFLEGECDVVFRALADAIGWKEDLDQLIASGVDA